MITGDLKNKIDSLWDIFAAGGLVNPLEVIEQITYLMFIHDLDDVDNKKAKECEMLGLPFSSIFADEVKIGDRNIDGKQLKWSVFRDFPAEKMYSVMQEWVFPFIKNLHSDKNSAYSKYMDDAIFKLPTPILLSKVVDSLDEIYKLMNEIQSVDVRGDVYEYLLSKIAQSGRNGQFRTPRHIIRMMVEMMDPAADEMICDPACGTSGFLVASGEYLREKKKEDIFYNKANRDHYMNHMFYGYDMDRTMLRIGAMNMMTHGIDNPCIEYRDSFRELYVKTEEEMNMEHSLRYAGNQIQPKKTLGCLKSRHWVADIEDGLQKVYYKENIVAQIYALADWFSPADIESPTLEWVVFSDRKTGKDIRIKDIPDIIFSEVMRDVDMAVSVAHAGGVDPETSHSTVEMRKAIAEFTMPLFRLTNVTFTKNHAVIEGKRANYTVHLGSGVVHQEAGPMINVLPVHSQRRGRIFLPFVDDDPKTSEVLTKILFFAEDNKIKDPYILGQIEA